MSLLELFTTSITADISTDIGLQSFLLCMGVSLVLGFVIALLYTYETRHTRGFVLTLAVIPAVVAMVIMMVNGNIGTGVAVAGTFSLIRFRSVPGTAREIGAIFLAMGAGLACGMGYLGFAIIFTLLIGLVNFLLNVSGFGKGCATQRTLTITIPETLDYTGVFDDLFDKYTKSALLERVKTTNMGSLFRVTYAIDLKSEGEEKLFIDDLRCRNGNLEITMAKQANYGTEL